MMAKKTARNTSVKSTVKDFARTKDRRGAYMAAITNHAGENKYRAIHKKNMNLLQNIKWNKRNYPMEQHVSSHRQAADDILECSGHIIVAVPDLPHRVKYLIDSIHCSDNNLQETLGLIRANTNEMRKNFDLASTALIKVDPYRRSQRPSQGKPGANISSIDFRAGRGKSGINLR